MNHLAHFGPVCFQAYNRTSPCRQLCSEATERVKIFFLGCCALPGMARAAAKLSLNSHARHLPINTFHYTHATTVQRHPRSCTSCVRPATTRSSAAPRYTPAFKGATSVANDRHLGALDPGSMVRSNMQMRAPTLQNEPRPTHYAILSASD